MAGRRPTSDADKKRKGNPGKRKIDESTSFVSVENHDSLEPPEYVREDNLALEEWHRMCPILSEAGILHPLDLNTLGTYCTTVSLFQKTKKILDKEGPLLEKASGEKYKNPAIGILADLSREIRLKSNGFGLNPSERSRLKIKMPEKGSKADLKSAFLT